MKVIIFNRIPVSLLSHIVLARGEVELANTLVSIYFRQLKVLSEQKVTKKNKEKTAKGKKKVKKVKKNTEESSKETNDTKMVPLSPPSPSLTPLHSLHSPPPLPFFTPSPSSPNF